jgi:hypothetical protein
MLNGAPRAMVKKTKMETKEKVLSRKFFFKISKH